MALGLGEPQNKVNNSDTNAKNKRKIGINPQINKELKKIVHDDLILSLEEETTDLSNQQSVFQFTQNSSTKLNNKSPTRAVKFNAMLPLRGRYGVDITPLSYVPGGKIEKYLGNLNFFFIRESTSIRENGGISGFVHSFITEVIWFLMLYYVQF